MEIFLKRTTLVWVIRSRSLTELAVLWSLGLLKWNLEVIILLYKCLSWFYWIWTSVVMPQNEVLLILSCCLAGHTEVPACWFTSSMIRSISSHLLRILSLKSILVSRIRYKTIKVCLFYPSKTVLLRTFQGACFAVKWRMQRALVSLERLVCTEYPHSWKKASCSVLNKRQAVKLGWKKTVDRLMNCI